MGFSGMSPDQIDLAAQQLEAQAQELQSINMRVNSLVDEAGRHWEGRDVSAFRTLWYNSYRVHLVSTASRLESMASELRQQATQQRATSSDSATTSGVGYEAFLPIGPFPLPTMPGEREAESSEDADSPWEGSERRGGYTPTSPFYPTWLGESVPGTTPIHPETPPWPDRDREINVGFGTRTPTLDDYASEDKWWINSVGAWFVGMPDAGDNMRHYLEGSGEDKELDVNSMLGTEDFSDYVSRKRADMGEQAIEQARASGATGPVTFPVSSPWVEFSFRKGNWLYAVGSVSVSQQGYVTVYPPSDGGPWRAEVSTQVSVFDVYNWDKGKLTQMPDGQGTIVTDAEMKELMYAGLAKEYNMYGTSVYSTETFEDQ